MHACMRHFAQCLAHIQSTLVEWGGGGGTAKTHTRTSSLLQTAPQRAHGQRARSLCPVILGAQALGARDSQRPGRTLPLEMQKLRLKEATGLGGAGGPGSAPPSTPSPNFGA